MEQADHWERVYAEKEPEEVSWFETVPKTSLAVIAEAVLPATAAILDVGGGTSTLAEHLVRAGYRDVTVADISDTALERARARFSAGDAAAVHWVQADVRSHAFDRTFDLWHDRAVFHFMVDSADRDGYLTVLRRTLRPGGHLVLATFGPDGPPQCSGLPVSRYGRGELSSVLESAFALISCQLEEHRTPTGRLQQFMYTHFVYQPPG
jgi:SAM-dependent methyltransferase